MIINSMKRNNLKLRFKMFEAGLKQWQVADLLGIREETLSRNLRHELPIAEQEQIIALIDKYMKHNTKEENTL